MSSQDFIHWGMDPEIFSVGPFHIRWYGLCFALAFLAGYQVMGRIYAREHKVLEDLDYLLLYMIIGVVLGARLGHCLLYEPGHYLSNPIELLAVWQGGLASHGGAIGVLIALYLYTRRNKDQPYLWLLSRMSIVSALGGSFIRVGNFFNSEILGRAAQVPWAIVFTRIDKVPRHPAQLYEAIGYLLIALLLYLVYRRHGENTDPKFLLGLYFSATFTFRFFVEFLKEPQASFETALPIDMGQILSVPFVLLGFWLVLTSPALCSSSRGKASGGLLRGKTSQTQRR